jgi:hypothetical protein
MQRLGAALKQSALKPRALTDKEEWERQQEGYETESEHEVDATEAEGVQGSSKDVEGREGAFLLFPPPFPASSPFFILSLPLAS